MAWLLCLLGLLVVLGLAKLLDGLDDHLGQRFRETSLKAIHEANQAEAAERARRRRL